MVNLAGNPLFSIQEYLSRMVLSAGVGEQTALCYTGQNCHFSRNDLMIRNNWTVICSVALLTAIFALAVDYSNRAKKKREAEQRDARKHARRQWADENLAPGDTHIPQTAIPA